MGLIAWTLGLPLMPVRGVVALGRVIQQQVEQETQSTQAAVRRLEQIQEERERHPEVFTEELEAEAVREAVGAQQVPRPPRPPRAPREVNGDGGAA